jgi:hypothetical protein
MVIIAVRLRQESVGGPTQAPASLRVQARPHLKREYVGWLCKSIPQGEATPATAFGTRPYLKEPWTTSRSTQTHCQPQNWTHGLCLCTFTNLVEDLVADTRLNMSLCRYDGHWVAPRQTQEATRHTALHEPPRQPQLRRRVFQRLYNRFIQYQSLKLCASRHCSSVDACT